MFSMNYKEDILFHQPSVDYTDSSGVLYETPLKETDVYAGHEVDESAVIVDAFRHVTKLKSVAGTPRDRVYDIAVPDNIYGIVPKRRGAFVLARELADAADEQSEVRISWHGLADVASMLESSDDPEAIHTRTLATGEKTYVRLEEALIHRAEHVIRAISDKGVSDDGKIRVEDDTLHIAKGSGRSVTIPLHGYTFNRNAADPSQREHIASLPSCEAFIAATVLEQASLSPHVVRVVPYWMKDRELLARDMLRMAGHRELPVLSVIAGETGDVEKVVRWPQHLPDTLNRLVPDIQARTAHRNSTQLSKRIHDTIFAEHSRLFQEYCRPHLESNLPPTAMQEFELLSDRAHQFLSRTLRAAPMYERGRIKPDSEDLSTILQDIFVMTELFGRNYQQKTLRLQAEPVFVRRYPGQNTNDVLYVQGRLASRPEEDPVTLPDSDQIDLIGHFVFERPSSGLLEVVGNKKRPARQSIRTALQTQAPRYVLLEARRSGQGLKGGTPVA